MSSKTMAELVEAAQRIVIVQADNPDGDSLGAALSLEAILSEQGKDTLLYCAVDMPDYLKYLEGWSRIASELPSNYDLSIIVDTSTRTLFEKNPTVLSQLATKPAIVLDHHQATNNDLDFATVYINDLAASSTCELIYRLAKESNWVIPSDSHFPLMTGILGDTQGLSNQLTRATTYQVMAALVADGADRPALEELRRKYNKMAPAIYKFKATLIEKTEFVADGRVALVTVTQADINTYSPLYNPGPLIQPDMLQVEGVLVGIVFKVYDDGKITGMIRCNHGAEVGDKLAAEFGGGGHSYAAGFKITDGTSFETIKQGCIEKITNLLEELPDA